MAWDLRLHRLRGFDLINNFQHNGVKVGSVLLNGCGQMSHMGIIQGGVWQDCIIHVKGTFALYTVSAI